MWEDEPFVGVAIEELAGLAAWRSYLKGRYTVTPDSDDFDEINATGFMRAWPLRMSAVVWWVSGRRSALAVARSIQAQGRVAAVQILKTSSSTRGVLFEIHPLYLRWALEAFSVSPYAEIYVLPAGL